MRHDLNAQTNKSLVTT